MACKLTILNGPNLNQLGVREPEIYGTVTLASVEASCREFAEILGADLVFRQTNHEGEMVDWVQQAADSADALIINPAGLSFRSIPLIDALKIFTRPIIELHISNIHARDELHRHSIVSAGATTVICGAGTYGYIIAMQTAARMCDAIPDSFGAPLRVGPV